MVKIFNMSYFPRKSYLNFIDHYNAQDNVPDLTSSYYQKTNCLFKVSQAGTQDLGNGAINFEKNDLILFNENQEAVVIPQNYSANPPNFSNVLILFSSSFTNNINTTPFNLPFDIPLINNDKINAQEGTFIVAETGRYLITFNIIYQASNESVDIRAKIAVNGQIFEGLAQNGNVNPNGGVDITSISLSAILNLNADDEVSVIVSKAGREGQALLLDGQSQLYLQKIETIMPKLNAQTLNNNTKYDLLHNENGLQTLCKNVDTDYNVSSKDGIVFCDCTNQNIVISLPPLTEVQNQIFTFVKKDTSNHIVEIKVNDSSTESINGDSKLFLRHAFESFSIFGRQSDFIVTSAVRN